MDGSKNSDRNVPVSSRMTNDYSAISPSMNDQWSGKTLRKNSRALAPVEPVIQPRPCPASAFGVEGMSLRRLRRRRSSALPEARADRLGEVALRRRGSPARPWSSAAAAAAAPPGRRSTVAPVVASKVDWWHGHRMWCVVCCVQRDRAAHVRADLGVGDDVVHFQFIVPTEGAAWHRVGMFARPAGTDQDHRGLGQRVVVAGEALGDAGDHAAGRAGSAGVTRRQSQYTSGTPSWNRGLGRHTV